MAADKKKTTKEIELDKRSRLMEGVAYWCSFYRYNPQRFCKDFLNIELKLFQKILIYAMMHNNYFLFCASRGQQLGSPNWKQLGNNKGKIGESFTADTEVIKESKTS